MNKPTIWKLALGVMCMVLAGPVSAEGDAVRGKSRFSTCMGCHGIPGYVNTYPTYRVPRVGGQHAAYITAALNAYRSGDRKHATMVANASALSEQDITDIATYLEGIPMSSNKAAAVGDAKAGEEKSQTCVACHGDGNNESNAFPKLAGQHIDYLIRALKDYKSGARNNAIMSGMAAGLSEQDQKDLAAYYANQPIGLAVVH